MSTRYSDEFVEYAKEFYLTVDKDGNRIYSLQKIADKCNKQFNVNVTKVTIKRWADCYGWRKLLSQAIVASAYDDKSREETQNTITQIVEKLPADEELIEKLARAKRWVVVNHLEMAQKLYSEVQGKDASDKRFARLCEVANQVGKTVYDMLEEVEGIKEKEENKQPVIIINEIPTGEKNESPS